MHESGVFVWIVGFLTSVNGDCAEVLWGHYNGFQIIYEQSIGTLWIFSQLDVPGQVQIHHRFWGKSLCFLRITYNYAGLEKSLMNDIFVSGIYQWVLPKLAFQSYRD
jgi:hypothetical protein